MIDITNKILNQEKNSIQNFKARSKSLCLQGYKKNKSQKINQFHQNKQKSKLENFQNNDQRHKPDKISKESPKKTFKKPQKSIQTQFKNSYYLSHHNFQIIQKDENIFLNLSSQNLQCLKLIDENTNFFSKGQNHFLYLNGSNKICYRQSNLKSNQQIQKSLNSYFLDKNIKIVNILCTPYCTFFIDSYNYLYGFGLNDRGQLGKQDLGICMIPKRINLPFQKQITQQTFINQFNNQKSNVTYEFSRQCLNQNIFKIQGGPFHTVILTNKKNIYCSGVVYKRNLLLNDEFKFQFTEIKIERQKVKDIVCGLTSTIFLTQNNKIYIMGLFGQNNFYEEPTDIELNERIQIKKICILNDKIYVMNKLGRIFVVDLRKKILKVKQIKVDPIYELIQLQSKRKFEDFYVLKDRVIFVSNNQKNCSNLIFFRQKIHSNSIQENLIEPIKMLNMLQVNKFVNIYAIGSYILFLSKQKITIINKKLPIYPIKNQQLLSNKNIKHSSSYNQKSLQSENFNFNQNLKINGNFSASNLKFQFNNQVNPRKFNQDLQIQFSQIKILNKIAEGGYGIIYKAQWKKTDVAVKIFKIDQNNSNQIKQFMSQCLAMEALRHPNIVMFLGACVKKPNYAIVLQYCKEGTLWSYLQNHKIQISWSQRLRIALEISKAMNYLHDRRNPIVHRDLKSLNILLDTNKRIKLADFGWTKSLQNYMTSKIGTYQWMAPQVLIGQQYTQKADVFSFSIILWEMASRQAPYRNIQGIQVAYDVANKQYRLTIPKQTPDYFKELIIRCWNKDPQKRPSFKEIINIFQEQQKNQI